GLLRKQCISFFTLLSLFSLSVNADATLPKEQYSTKTLATHLQSPWSMVELPNGTWLITERDGHVVIVKNNVQSRVELNLTGLYVAGQGG
ncbi:PQQ-dependent sugar dehydrogenase, partial [Psychrobacter sp. GW64-MNA-CIBAN-0177]|uniref:PQQ-dependent sugar dehydrogenase n=1 Tax=Psychrobacter sp. GW64-MNA-CIBAN-0177 TaxID=3140449 RepID=UPI0033258002